MKALSIRQPWAWLICAGFKDVENRTWPTDYRGRIYVHAGKRFDYDGYNYLCRHADMLRGIDIDQWATLVVYPATGIIGEVDIVECTTDSDDPWFEGPFGFVLANPVLYEHPIPYKGRLGLFDVTEVLP